jgi:hypothetical protein
VADWKQNKYGLSTELYIPPGSISAIPAPGTKGESSNVLTWTRDPEEIVKDLFAGSGGAKSGKKKEECEDMKGKIRGSGPDCSPLKEEGDHDSALCFYNETLECIQSWRASVYASSLDYIDTMLTNKDQANESFKHGFSQLFPSDMSPESLDESRETFDDAGEEYKACLEEIEDLCECDRCVWGGGDGDDEKEDTDTGAPNPTANDTPKKDDTSVTSDFREIRTISGFDVIPRVWGRYVLGGNIVWTGGVRTVVNNTFKPPRDGEGRPITVFDTTLDFSLGLCAGEVESLLRVWFDDIKIVDRLLNPITDRNYTSDLFSAPLATNPHDLTVLSKRQPKLKLELGTKSQKVNKDHAEKDGFGRSPAYRELSFLHFKDVNLAVFPNDFPKIRVDIATNTEPVTDYVETAPEPEVYGLSMNVDPRSGSLTVQTEDDEYVIYDWDTMEERFRGVCSFDVYPMILESGYQAYFDYDFNQVRLVDVAYPPGRVLVTEYAPVTPLVTNNDVLLARTIKYTDSKSRIPYDVIYCTQFDNNIGAFRVDYTNNKILETSSLFSSPQINSTVETVQADSLAILSGITTYFQMSVPNVSGTHIKITKNAVMGINYIFKDQLLPSDVTSSTIPASVWGGGVSNVNIRQAIYCHHDNTILLFVSQDTVYTCIKIDAMTLSVIWSSTGLPAFFTWATTSNPLSRGPIGVLKFVTSNGTVQRLNLDTGELSTEVALVPSGYPAYIVGSSQHYDARTDSLFYFSLSGLNTKIVRLFFDRLSPVDVPISTIVNDLARITEQSINTSGVTGVTVKGYAVQSTASIKSFFTDFADFFHLILTDNGTSLTMNSKALLSAPVVLSPTEDLLENSSEGGMTTSSKVPDSLSVSFVTIDEAGLNESLQIVSSREVESDYSVFSSNDIKYTLGVYEEPLVMRQYAEKALRSARSESRQTRFGLMPKLMRLGVQDSVSLLGDVFRINRHVQDPLEKVILDGKTFSTEDYSFDVALSTSALNTTNFRPRVVKAPFGKPVILFANAITNEDSLRSVGGEQVVYTLIESKVHVLDGYRVKMRTLSHTQYYTDEFNVASSVRTKEVDPSPAYISKKHTVSAHVGLLTVIPQTRELRPDWGRVREEDFLEITFDKVETLDQLALLTFPDDKSEIPADSRKNLLIVGQELIQFGAYQIMDAPNKVVRFSHLFRGIRGTESYLNHVAGGTFLVDDGDGGFNEITRPGDRVYLYTEDTILPMGVDAYFTKFNTSTRVWIDADVPAGYSPVDYIQKASAGSARAWAPSHAKIYSLAGDQTHLRVSFVKRDPLVFSEMDNLGPSNGVYGPTVFMMKHFQTAQGILYNPENNYELFSTTVPQISEITLPLDKQRTDIVDGEVIASYDITHTATNMTRWVTLLVSQISRDGQNEPIMGHPAIVYIHAGSGVQFSYPPVP